MKNIFGLGNKIAKGVIQGKNIKIGNNNIIYPGSKIFDNTTIGNNNVILSGNILGEYPIHSNCDYKDLKRGGLEIGDNNFLHVNNLVFSGFSSKTIIGNYNKLLAETHIGHDAEISNYVYVYARAIIGGHSKLLDYSGVGMFASVHQKLVLGQYSFIGMNNTITKNVFPFYININNKLHRLNKKKLNENSNYYNYLLNNENILLELEKKENKEEILDYIEKNFQDNSIVKNILIEYYKNL